MDGLDRYTLDYKTEVIGKAPVYTPVIFIVKEVPKLSYNDTYTDNSCPLCNKSIGRKHSRYFITSDNVLFPTVICHRDCVHDFFNGNVVDYTSIVDKLVSDYEQVIECKALYERKYKYWFTDRAVLL